MYKRELDCYVDRCWTVMTKDVIHWTTLFFCIIMAFGSFIFITVQGEGRSMAYILQGDWNVCCQAFYSLIE